MLNGESFQDVIADHPEMVLKYNQYKASVHQYRLEHGQAVARCEDLIPNNWAYNGIAARLQMPLYPGHLTEDPKGRKKRHYWLWS